MPNSAMSRIAMIITRTIETAMAAALCALVTAPFWLA
jgi:hypothetical protein